MIPATLTERILKKKGRLDALRPLPKTALKKLRERFEVEWTYNSNAIEGNTLNLRETALVLQDGLTIGGKSMQEHLEATNHETAIKFIYELVKKKKIGRTDLLEIHALILDRIDPENAGFYRRHRIHITGSTNSFPSPHKIPKLMTEFCNSFKNEPNKSKIEIIEFAAKAHFKLVDIHPFIDGNGRAARLLMNLFLIRGGFPPAIILKTERKKYYNTLEVGHKGNIAPFSELIARSIERSLDLYLEALDTPSKETDFLLLRDAAKESIYSQDYLSLRARQSKLHALKQGRNWLTTRKWLEEYEKANNRKR